MAVKCRERCTRCAVQISQVSIKKEAENKNNTKQLTMHNTTPRGAHTHILIWGKFTRTRG